MRQSAGFVALLITATALAQTAPVTQPTSAPAHPVHMILLTQSKGFQHDVVKRIDNKDCLVETVIKQLADKTHLFDVEATQDASIITPEKLKQTQLLVFYTTGDLPMSVDALDQWIREGGSFLGIHCATDTFHGNAKYLSLINGEFEAHPWGNETTVTLKVDDPNHPATKTFPEHHTIKEEIYQQKNFDPSDVHLLMSLDMERTAMKRNFHVPIAWCKEYGKGKIFYTELGHNVDVWTSPAYQDHLMGAVRWLINLDKADAAPNPQVSEQELKIARATTGPSVELPKVPEGFHISEFIHAPEIYSPSSICVTPDGKVFVGEDEYNTGTGIEPGISRVKLCIDSDGDGRSDRVTVFADKLNAPQGMTFVGDTLYISHAPFLTAFKDTNNDGIADVREDLVTGLGPAPVGLVHHIPSGVRMAIDGFLYIAIGDKGIKEATGKDGRRISLHGGGVVRVRPDGTELQIFSIGTRNIFAVSIDPYLNAFTRDNTNDGGGWNVRLTQMQRDAVYGYPSLFVNYPEEIVPCIADYGGGGPTGSMYLHEPNFPKDYGDSLYTLDWGRGILFRHVMIASGATFTATQEEFSKMNSPTAIDADGLGRIFVADWHRKSWGKHAPEGIIYAIEPNQMVAASFPDMHALTARQLLNQIVSPSQVRRREAQWEILHRAGKFELFGGLAEIAEHANPLYARVAAIFTMIQLDPAGSREILPDLAREPELREYIIRALADRDVYLKDVDPKFFSSALTDHSPRVRTQAAIAMGHLNKPEQLKSLVWLTADPDVMVRQAAMQSLRQLNAIDPCFNALNPAAPAERIFGVLRTLRGIHDAKVVTRIASYLDSESNPTFRQEAIKTLARLYQVEAPWDGSWWETRPDTKGPYYKPVAWDQSPAVANLFIKLIADPNPDVAKAAVTNAGLSGVKEAIPALTKLMSDKGPLQIDAAKSLIQMKSNTPEALAAIEQILLSDSFDNELRTSAAQALGNTEGTEARATLLRVIARIDANPLPPTTVPTTAPTATDAILDRCSDSIAAKPASVEDVATIDPLLKANRPSIRVAAAASLLRSDVPTARQRLAKIFPATAPTTVATVDDSDSESGIELQAILLAIPRVPADRGKGSLDFVRPLLKDSRLEIRHAAIDAVGYLADAGSVDELLALSRKQSDTLPAASALASLGPEKIPDKQLLAIARLLVESTTTALHAPPTAPASPVIAHPRRKRRPAADAGISDVYAKLLAAAQKFLADPRVPKDQATSLLSQLKQPGVIDLYQRTDPIPTQDTAQSFAAVFPPETTPNGPFAAFSVKEKSYIWQPQPVEDPRGIQRLQMPDNSVIYLTATIPAPTTLTPALLTLGTDDGIKVWHNGKQIHANDLSRALKPDVDKIPLTLTSTTNTLLFRVNNHGDGAGIQARLRTHTNEFEPEELPELVQKFPGTPDKGKTLFTTLNCVKCHTTTPQEEPKGPYLGDAGSKYDLKYLTESICHPSAKIAQGFQTNKINATINGASTEYVGFVTKESGDELQLRDATGAVTTVKKSTITRRVTLPTSIMPDGLTNTIPLDDFGSLVTYLQSLKAK